jgi:hypothetical protein
MQEESTLSELRPVPLLYIRTRSKTRGNTAADELRYKRKTGVFRHICGEELLR